MAGEAYEAACEVRDAIDALHKMLDKRLGEIAAMLDRLYQIMEGARR